MSGMRLDSISDGQFRRSIVPGDAVIRNRKLTTLSTVGAGTLTASALAGGIIVRDTAGGAFSDTTDTAVNIMQALLGGSGQSGPIVGETFEVLYRNSVGSIMTIAGGTGVTVAGIAAVPVTVASLLHFTCTAVGTNTLSAGVWTNVGATFTVNVIPYAAS